MDIYSEKSSTQYGDWKGKISLDGHGGGSGLHNLYEDFKLDENYFPIGFTWSMYGIKNSLADKEASVTIYAMDKRTAGSGHDEISQNIRVNGGKATVKEFHVDLNMDDFSKYFKAMQFFVIQNGLDKLINELDVEFED